MTEEQIESWTLSSARSQNEMSKSISALRCAVKDGYLICRLWLATILMEWAAFYYFENPYFKYSAMVIGGICFLLGVFGSMSFYNFIKECQKSDELILQHQQDMLNVMWQVEKAKTNSPIKSASSPEWKGTV